MNLKDLEQVKELQKHMRTCLESDAGKEVLKFMDELCGWYDFSDIDPNVLLVKNGKRQVLATIKTILKLDAEQIVKIAEQQEQ